MLLSSSTPLSYSGQRMLSAIGTILDSLIAFRILFPLVREVNPLPSRHYILQLSLSTIISGNGNMSPKGLHTPHCNVLYIRSALSLSLICQSLTLVLILTSRSLLISIPLGNTLYLRTSLTLTPDCHCLSPILVLVSKSSTSALFSAPQQIPSLELSDSDSVLSFLTSGFISRVLESPVKLESLVDLLSRLGSSLSSELLF